tara:strand:+ start:107 stop:391 length:285 start_codon:yes stop_codon:yes gene_type:complete
MSKYYSFDKGKPVDKPEISKNLLHAQFLDIQRPKKSLINSEHYYYQTDKYYDKLYTQDVDFTQEQLFFLPRKQPEKQLTYSEKIQLWKDNINAS